jgi:hypothetical protein
MYNLLCTGIGCRYLSSSNPLIKKCHDSYFRHSHDPPGLLRISLMQPSFWCAHLWWPQCLHLVIDGSSLPNTHRSIYRDSLLHIQSILFLYQTVFHILRRSQSCLTLPWVLLPILYMPRAIYASHTPVFSVSIVWSIRINQTHLLKVSFCDFDGHASNLFLLM